jgi:hypothetical protein
MSTLIRITRDGHMVAQCDSHCYDATVGTECKCACAGICHGQGLEWATRLLWHADANALLNIWCERHDVADRAGLSIWVQSGMAELLSVPVVPKRPKVPDAPLEAPVGVQAMMDLDTV